MEAVDAAIDLIKMDGYSEHDSELLDFLRQAIANEDHHISIGGRSIGAAKETLDLVKIVAARKKRLDHLDEIEFTAKSRSK